MFRFFLNTTELRDKPDGWSDFTIQLERDWDNRTLLFKYPSTITFFGQAYKILNDYRISSTFCSEITFQVDYKCNQGWRTIFNGLIFISDCKFNISKCRVECNVEDNSFSARIFNNKSIEFQPDGGKTKNDEDITPLTPVDVDFFNPTGGAYTWANRPCYDLKEVFEYAVSFMTDNAVGFISDWYDNLSDDDKIVVTTGQNIRNADGTPPVLEFEKLFNDIANTFNLWMTIETDATGSYLRIEEESYFFTEDENFQMINIEDLRLSYDQNRLFSSIRVGSNEAVKDGSIGTLPYVRFIAFVDEKYMIQTTCNIDRTFDFTNDGIVDSNVIEDILINATEDWDDDYFYVNYNPTTGQASQYDILGDGGTYYNKPFTNSEVAARYQLLGAIASILGDGQDYFLATRTSSLDYEQFLYSSIVNFDISEPFAFENDCTGVNFDTNSNYDGGAVCGGSSTYRYTVPALSDGWYAFRSVIRYNVLEICNRQLILRIIHKRYNSGAVLQEEREYFTLPILSVNPPTVNYSEITSESSFACAAGDYIHIEVEANIIFFPAGCPDTQKVKIRFPAGSTFECIGVFNGGGIFQPGELEEYLAAIYTFEYPLSQQEIEDVQANPVKSFGISHDRFPFQAWARSVEMNVSTGRTSFELITRIKNTE